MRNHPGAAVQDFRPLAATRGLNAVRAFSAKVIILLKITKICH